jgi:hypothetical protein
VIAQVAQRIDQPCDAANLHSILEKAVGYFNVVEKRRIAVLEHQQMVEEVQLRAKEGLASEKRNTNINKRMSSIHRS